MGNHLSWHTDTHIPDLSNVASDSRSKATPLSNGSRTSSYDGSGFSNQNTCTNGSLHMFTYSQMKTATKNFRRSHRIGEGGFGVVYKGFLDEKTLAPLASGHKIIVAIKKLNTHGMQGHDEWVTEVKLLGALRHPNIVRLIGFCAKDESRLLVYEYMSRGSLENHLFADLSKSHRKVLSWEIRMKIAVGAARGLEYLHNAKTQIIYRDFKAANILLDDQFNAKLSDFGLATYGPSGDDTHVSTRVLGTYGYAAPEYLATGHLSSRSDVYSFGVVLLELLSGRPALGIETQSSEELKVVDWARPYLHSREQVHHIMDPKLNGKYPPEGAIRVVRVASLCLQMFAKARPTMKEVVKSLEPLLTT
ncbi:hypothetical protein KP509_19G042900 [Ceratopteris richardii]|uniref:non-specific serine/threonine protein kinase n=1 Tax=Ceratopteris richardii TaxID=49495 RepID=A0A8T2SP09_CERRI|nr:hypothetical protein KP509_19G042900 [Ceratopteris richardii]KAH7352399.1 hypothetical protein KP509_19G042900 [Ceratopteris richardii]